MSLVEASAVAKPYFPKKKINFERDVDRYLELILERSVEYRSINSPLPKVRVDDLDDESDSEYALTKLKSIKSTHPFLPNLSSIKYLESSKQPVMDKYGNLHPCEVYRPQKKKKKPRSIDPPNRPQKAHPSQYGKRHPCEVSRPQKEQPKSISPESRPKLKRKPKSREDRKKMRKDCQKIPRSQIGVSYGNLPDYVASLVKKMPTEKQHGGVRQGQIIKLTPKQQQYMSFDVVYPPEIVLGECSVEGLPRFCPGDVIAAKEHLAKAIKLEGDPDEHFFSFSKYIKEMSQDLAAAALSYLREKGESLELVKPSLFEFKKIWAGIRVHLNFQAKRTDILDAPVETYFAQMRFYGYVCEGPNIVVECCVSLGLSDLLPCERDNRGCQYCTKFVHHPADGCVGMKWGFSRFSVELSRLVDI